MVDARPRPAATRLRLVCFTLHDQEYGVAIEDAVAYGLLRAGRAAEAPAFTD